MRSLKAALLYPGVTMSQFLTNYSVGRFCPIVSRSIGTGPGVEPASALQRLYPGNIDSDNCKALTGNHALREGLKAGTEPLTRWLAVQDQAAHSVERRTAYLLY